MIIQSRKELNFMQMISNIRNATTTNMECRPTATPQPSAILSLSHYTDILWWQTLLRHFRTTKTTFQMLCNKIGLLVSQVFPSIVQSHMTFLMRMWNLFGKFVSIIVYTHFSFLLDEKFIYSVVRIMCIFFLCAFFEFMHILAFTSNVFYALFQNEHKNRWMET